MQPEANELEILVQRVREGDYKAKAELKEYLEPSLVCIVRRVLARGTADSVIEQKILVAARRLAPRGVPAPGDHRAASLAYDLCQIIINRLWPGQTEEAWLATLAA
jgi:hypothetical protein